MTNEKVMRLALDALEYNQANWQGKNKALEALYAALVQPKREWQGLTNEERTFIAWESNNGLDCVAITEAKLKEKNT